jgi:hypothetical protein
MFLMHLVELGDAMLGRWALHVLLTPVVSLVAWVLWLPLHRVADRAVLRSLGALAWFAAGAFRLLRVVQLVNLPLDWSHVRPHAAAWAGVLCLAMATVELYCTYRAVSELSGFTVTEQVRWNLKLATSGSEALDVGCM